MSFLRPLLESWEHTFEQDLEFLTVIEEGEYRGDVVLSLIEEKNDTWLEKRIRREVSEFLVKNGDYQEFRKGFAAEDGTFFYHWPKDEDGEGDPYPHDKTKEAA